MVAGVGAEVVVDAAVVGGVGPVVGVDAPAETCHPTEIVAAVNAPAATLAALWRRGECRSMA